MYLLIKGNTKTAGFNPYFTGLPILIVINNMNKDIKDIVSILILLDYLFLLYEVREKVKYFKVSILILLDYLFLSNDLIKEWSDQVEVSILILLDYLFLYQSLVWVQDLF